jgi:hypothetical protein
VTESPIAGRVIGTEDSTPLEFWVAIADGQFLQLDDVVALERKLPNGETVRIFGMVTQVRARHEGARFDSDVFLIENGVLPAQVSQAARIVTTRFEPDARRPTPIAKATSMPAVGTTGGFAVMPQGWQQAKAEEQFLKISQPFDPRRMYRGNRLTAFNGRAAGSIRIYALNTALKQILPGSTR